jgi:hypothetical protein
MVVLDDFARPCNVGQDGLWSAAGPTGGWGYRACVCQVGRLVPQDLLFGREEKRVGLVSIKRRLIQGSVLVP